MTKIFAHIISFVFHPVFILYYIFLSLIIITPYDFMMPEGSSVSLLHGLIVGLSIFFPLITIGIMKVSGLISDFQMKTKKERIGPLIAIVVYYVWLFLNYSNLNLGPKSYRIALLGGIIALFLSFLLNLFSKISLHAVGAGGLIGAIFIYRFLFDNLHYEMSFNEFTLLISPNIFLFIVVLIGGLIGSSRLLLNKHNMTDIYGGFIVGLFSQIIGLYIYNNTI